MEVVGMLNQKKPFTPFTLDRSILVKAHRNCLKLCMSGNILVHAIQGVALFASCVSRIIN